VHSGRASSQRCCAEGKKGGREGGGGGEAEGWFHQPYSVGRGESSNQVTAPLHGPAAGHLHSKEFIDHWQGTTSTAVGGEGRWCAALDSGKPKMERSSRDQVTMDSPQFEASLFSLSLSSTAASACFTLSIPTSAHVFCDSGCTVSACCRLTVFDVGVCVGVRHWYWGWVLRRAGVHMRLLLLYASLLCAEAPPSGVFFSLHRSACEASPAQVFQTHGLACPGLTEFLTSQRHHHTKQEAPRPRPETAVERRRRSEDMNPSSHQALHAHVRRHEWELAHLHRNRHHPQHR